MASQQTAATEVKVKQVIGGSEYCGQIQGISEDQLDRTTVHTFFRSFNETARDDCDLTEEQAANMRFVPEGEEPHSLPLLSTDPTLTISNRVKEIADLVEKQLIEDAVIADTDDEVIQSCLKPVDGQEDTDSAASTRAPPIDLYQVKDHLVKVFGHLLSREELINATPMKVVIRFASGIAYCYNFCKKILLQVLHNFVPDTVVDLMCGVASVFLQHLIKIGFEKITQNLGGWVQLAGSLAFTKALSAATDRLGTSKYFFAFAAVASAGIALYLHFSGK